LAPTICIDYHRNMLNLNLNKHLCGIIIVDNMQPFSIYHTKLV
jgi:hypothetical protein